VDDAWLTVRGEVTPRVPPRRIVFTRSGEISPASRLLTTPEDGPIVIAQLGTPPLGTIDHAGPAVTVVRGSDPESLMEALWQTGITSILIEGGGELAGVLLAAGLVDRFYWIQSPLFLGDRGIPAFQGVPASLLGSVERWRAVERRSLGQDTLLVVDR
jgi:diaminohydroxyphosphoribosylaminopyrimidine deaminase/5-amino-6-(5-phosphoribosylamino)uracil reductase